MEPWAYILLFAAPFTGGLVSLLTGGSKRRNRLKIFLSFSGSYLFAITVLSLIPEIYNHASPKTVGIFVLIGFFFQIVIEQFSKGVEHGHVHAEDFHQQSIPFPLFISLAIHAFMEGMPLGGEIFADTRTTYNLLFGIALHELPAAFALASVLMVCGLGKWKTALFVLIYALMSPTGAFLSSWFKDFQALQNGMFNNLMAIVIGTFLHISTTILFENSENHLYTRYKMIAIAMGALIGLITIL